jgi:hypothetical protein
MDLDLIASIGKTPAHALEHRWVPPDSKHLRRTDQDVSSVAHSESSVNLPVLLDADCGGCASLLAILRRTREGVPMTNKTSDVLEADELDTIDCYFRAANYLTVGQIYLQANPLLREPLTPAHIAAPARALGTSPGLT